MAPDPRRNLPIEALLAAKARRRRALARLPYLKKVEVVLKLQRIENEVRRATGRPARPAWPA